MSRLWGGARALSNGGVLAASLRRYYLPEASEGTGMSRQHDDTNSTDLSTLSVSELLGELARRFRLRFGRLEVTYHDGCPSPRVTVEHRIQRGLDES